MKKTKPLTFIEHIELAKDLRKAQEILQPWLEKLWQSYGVNSSEASQMYQVLNLLSSKLCCKLDDKWYKIMNELPLEDQTNTSPYYGKNKSAY